MELSEVIKKETGVPPENIMLLRHSNRRVRELLKYGEHLLEEYTLIQPIDSDYDFLSENKPPIEILAVIVYDKFHAIYRIQGVEKIGTTYDLVSAAHRELTKKWKHEERPAKKFRAVKLQSSSIGMPISGWTSPRTTVARYGGKLFETTKINIESNSCDYPDEILEANCVEGAKKSSFVNKYERDSTAKGKCVGKWGVICVVCGFDFEKAYGCRGAGFIHVHHLIPLSEIRQEYSLDPIADLRPICPNCHSIIHRYKPAISIEALKKLLKKPAEA